jgi:sulfur-oxidizing protein SoxY
MLTTRLALASLTGAALLFASSASASQSWPAIKDQLYAGKTIQDGSKLIKLDAPDRPEDQMNVPIGIDARLADGKLIKTVTIIVDENPTPVAAKFNFEQARKQAGIAANFRFDKVTGVRAIVETTDGELYMTERHVRFTGGQSACSAPPNGTPEEIAAKMGKMQLATVGPKAVTSNEAQRVKYSIGHPNNTGMVLDQITLYYIPLNLMERIEFKQSGKTVVSFEGSMSLSQDPTFEFDFLTDGSDELAVSARDTIGGAWSQVLPLGCVAKKKRPAQRGPFVFSAPDGNYSAANRTISPCDTGHAVQSSDRASTKRSICASVCSGDGVKRMRSVPRGTVG